MGASLSIGQGVVMIGQVITIGLNVEYEISKTFAV